MRKFLALGGSIAALALPSFAFAQSLNTAGLNSSINALTVTVNYLVPFGLAVAVVVFIYGIIRYILAKDQESQAKSRSYIIWGIIGIAVILAVLGLARLLVSFFGINNNTVQRTELPSIATQ